MQEHAQPVGDNQTPKNTNHNPLSAAKTLFKALPIGLRRIIYAALIIFIGIVGIAILHPSMNERWKFGTEMTLNLLILLAIAVQAYIYTKQWGAMEDGLEQGRQALEISERARLGIHSIKENFETGRVVIRIENTGKAPAADIEVFAEGVAHIPEPSVPDETTKALPWKRFGNGWQLTWPLNVDYGNTTLLAGNNPLILPFSLNSWLNRNQRKVMEDGNGHLIFRGHISFHDGFKCDQKTEFAFKYSKGERDWIHHPINTPEEVMKKLRERSEQYFGKEGPLFRMIESYPPQIVISPKEAKPDEKAKEESEENGENPN